MPLASPPAPPVAQVAASVTPPVHAEKEAVEQHKPFDDERPDTMSIDHPGTLSEASQTNAPTAANGGDDASGFAEPNRATVPATDPNPYQESGDGKQLLKRKHDELL